MATAKKIASAADQVNQCMADQDRARRLRSFEVLGRVYSIETALGRIQLEVERPVHKPGAVIAQQVDDKGEATGQLLFLTPWVELPALPQYSEDFCPKCLATCDICNGSGKERCLFDGCGGLGTVKAGEQACACVTKSTKSCTACGGQNKLCGVCLGTGQVRRPDAACETCGGYGAIPVRRECPSCKGTGSAVCGPCRGTGQRPTGKKGNDMCPHCRGSQRDGKWVQQDISKVIVGKMGGCLVIGPVLRLVIVPPAGDVAVDRNASRFQASQPAKTSAFLRIKPAESGTDLYILLPTIVRKGEPMMAYCYGVKQG